MGVLDNLPFKENTLSELSERVKGLPSQKAANILRLSKKFDAPVEDVAANYEAYLGGASDTIDWDALKKTAPATADFMSDPYNMAIMRDKANRLGEIEGGWKAWRQVKESSKDIARSLLGEVVKWQEGAINSPATPEAYISNEIGNAARLQPKNFAEAPSIGAPYPQPLKRAETLRSAINSDLLKPGLPVTSDFGGKINETLLGDKTWGDLGLGIVSMLPQIVGQAVAFGLGGPAGSFAFNTGMIGGGQYLDMTQDPGMDPQRALVASTSNALAQAWMEQISLNKMFKRLPVNSPAAYRWRERAESTLTEAFTEWMQQYPEAAAEIFAKNPGTSREEMASLFAKDFTKNTQEGLFQGLVAAPFGFVGRSISMKMQEMQTEAFVKMVDTVRQKVVKAELLGVSPEATEAHLAAVTENKSIFIEPEAVLTLYQMEILSQDEIDDLLRIDKQQVEQAIESGELIEVPLSKYTVATAQNPELGKALDEHISETEEGITIARTRSKNTKDISEAIRRTNEDATGLKSAQKELYDELVTAGMGAKEAKETVAIYTANSRIMAASRGANHAEWFRENRPVFRKGQEIPVGVMPQYHQSAIDFVSKALSDIKVKGEFPVRAVSDYEARVVKEKTGIDIAGFTHVLNGDDIRHIIKKHGEGKEKQANQIGLTRDDLMMITQILDSPDDIQKSSDHVHGQTIKYIKADGSGVSHVVELVRKKDQKLHVKTMWKQRPSQISAGEADLRHTSDNGEGETASKFDFSIARDGIEYKQTAKGSIHWENGRAVIQLFATADASTGIHELLGHYMAQNLLDLGAQEDAPEWMQKDRQTMLEWAGVENWDTATKEQKVEAHEKWARAAEAYVMEGKAPSLEMRGVFRRFADWLRQVYRSVKELGVEISPEMRSVFDRMLASEEEIQQAAEINDFMSDNSGLYEGMSADAKDKLTAQMDKILDQGKELLLKELIGDINSERKAEMGREREKIEAEVREELSNQPFYRMVRELRKPSVRNPFNELTKQWQGRIDEMAKYLRANHGAGVENVTVFDADINDEQAKSEAFYRVSHNVKWYQDWYKDHGKAPTVADYKMLAEEFLRNGFDDLSGHVDPDVDFLDLERQIEELQQTPQAMPIVRKLNTQWIKEYYPDKLNLFAFMYSGTGQYTLDDMAAWYNFSSADEIVWRMENTPPLSKAIHDAVEARMNAAFPEMSKEEIRQAAEASMYNEESASLLAIQLGLIREKAGQIMAAEESRKQAMQDRELARASAQKAIERMSMDRAMNLQTWIAAERRAAEKVEKAIADGDWATAFEQKTIQLHNHAMVQESLKARREFDRVNRFLKRQQQSGSETWITDEKGPDGTVSKSDRHFAAASEIMKRFGYGRKDAVAMTETLAQYVHRMEEENPEMVSIADWIANDTKSASLRDLTMNKLRDIEAALRNIKKMARTGRNADGFRVLNGDGLVATVNNLADTAEANVKDRLVDLPDKVKPGAIAELFAGLRKPAKWLLELDGFKEFGAWSKAFYHALADATNVRSFLENRALQRLEAAYEKAGIDKAQRYRDAHEKIYIPEFETSVSKNWLMAVLLNMGSESNMQRLFSRHPVGINMNVAWNQDTLTTVLTRELGANYFHLAQDIWNAIDMYDEYTGMVKKVTGASLRKVDPTPISFTLPSGETVHLQGGYYHLKADRRSSMQAELNAEKELGDTPGIMPYPQTGASKARAFGAAYSVDLDLSNIYQSIHNQAHDIAFRPVAIDLNKLMRSETIKEVFRRKMGDASYAAFDKWLRVIETGRDTTVESRGFMDSGANFLRQRAVIANLLYRMGTVFQNMANPFLYGNSVEGFTQKDAMMAYMKYGWGDYIPKALSGSAEAETFRQNVFVKSAMMKDKAENPDYTMRDMFSRDGGFMMDSSIAAAREAGVRLKITRDNIVKFGSNMLAFGDQMNDMPFWQYAYDKAINEGRSEREAVRFADSVIENSTGTGRAIDSSLLQMGIPLEKLLTMFMTFLNTQYNRWANEYGIYMKEKDHLRLLSFLGTQYILFGAFSAVFSFKWKKDDEDWTEWFAKEVLEWPLSMIPVGGGLAKHLFDNWMGFKTYSWSVSPVERNIEQLLRLGSAYKSGKATTEDTMTSLAFVFGYPDQFNDWFWNAYDAANGMNPRLEDLIRRRPRKER